MKKFIPRALALLILVSLPGSASRLANAQPNFIALHPGQFQQIDQNIKLTSFRRLRSGKWATRHSGNRLPLGVASDPG